MINPATASPDVRAAILDLYKKIDQVNGSANVDFHQRRIMNAGDSIDSSDYVTRRETDASARELQKAIDELRHIFDSPFSLTGDVLITGRLTVGGFVHQTGAQTTITSSTLTQLALRYDATDYVTFAISSAGLTTITTAGTTCHLVLAPGPSANCYVTKPFCVSPSGVITVSANLVSQKTTEQLRLAYDATHYLSCTTSSAGQQTFATVGTGGSAHIILTPEAASYAYSTRPFGVMATPATVSAQLASRATTEQLRLEYDATHYGSFTVTSAGVIGVTATATTDTVNVTSATATNQLRLSYDGSNSVTFSVSGAGSLSVSDVSATNAGMSFSSVGTGVFYFNTGDVGIGIGLGANAAKLHVTKTTKQLRLGYDDATNIVDFTVSSGGDLTLAAKGTTLTWATSTSNATLALDATAGSGHLWLVNSLSDGRFQVRDSTAAATRIIIDTIGLVGFGQATPTARLHLQAGSATANTAPIKLASGTLLTTKEDGTFEYDGAHLYFTIGTTRNTIV